MGNDLGFTNSGVEIGAPMLTINEAPKEKPTTEKNDESHDHKDDDHKD